MQNWYFQGAPNASYFESLGIHQVGIVYESSLGSPAAESKTRTAADNTVNRYWHNIVMLDYEYQLLVDPRQQGDSAAIAYFKSLCTIARWFKTQQPAIKTGFFGYLPLDQPDGKNSSFWAGNRAVGSHLASWQAANDKMRFLLDSVDFVSPGIYPWYPDTTEWCEYTRANIAEAKRIAQGKPVYPVITPQGFPVGGLTLGVPVGYDYFARMLKVIKESGADGVIIWGSTLEGPNNYQWDANAGWWMALKEFMASLAHDSASTPNTPTIVVPADGATDQPPSFVSRWRKSPGAQCYHLQVSDNMSFENPLVNDSTITDTLRQVASLNSETRYYCRIRAKGPSSWSSYSASSDFETTTLKTDVALNQNLPRTYSLSQNFPNPFNPGTIIRFGLPAKSSVSITIYSTTGEFVQQIVDGVREAGFHEVSVDSAGLSSGVYFYRLQAGDFVATKKLIVMK
jgi:hypothetical protein